MALAVDKNDTSALLTARSSYVNLHCAAGQQLCRPGNVSQPSRWGPAGPVRHGLLQQLRDFGSGGAGGRSAISPQAPSRLPAVILLFCTTVFSSCLPVGSMHDPADRNRLLAVRCRTDLDLALDLIGSAFADASLMPWLVKARFMASARAVLPSPGAPVTAGTTRRTSPGAAGCMTSASPARRGVSTACRKDASARQPVFDGRLGGGRLHRQLLPARRLPRQQAEAHSGFRAKRSRRSPISPPPSERRPR